MMAAFNMPRSSLQLSVMAAIAAILVLPSVLHPPVVLAQPSGERLRSAAIDVVGTTAFVSAGPYGLYVLDVSASRSPRRVGVYPAAGWANSVSSDGTRAFVAGAYGGLHVLDVEDPTMPTHTYRMAEAGHDVYGVIADGALLYDASDRGLRTWALGDIDQPEMLSQSDTGGRAWNIVLADSLAYVTDGSRGLRVFDVSDPAQPEALGSYPVSGARGLDVLDGVAYVGAGADGLHIIDVRDPSRPELLAVSRMPGRARAVVARPGFVYVAGWDSGVQTIDVSNLRMPFVTSSHPVSGRTHGVTVEGSLLYVGTTHGSVVILDVSVPEHLTAVGEYRPFELFLPIGGSR